MSKSLLPMFSQIFMVSGITFRSLIQFTFGISCKKVVQLHSFAFVVQFSQCHLLQGTVSFSLNLPSHFVKDSLTSHPLKKINLALETEEHTHTHTYNNFLDT